VGKVAGRIKAFICCLLAGLIYLYVAIGSVTGLGVTVLEYIQEFFPGLLPIEPILSILLQISNWVGIIAIVCGFLFLAGQRKAANIILIITMSSGIFGFLVPVILAIPEGLGALEIAINGIATKYAVPVLFLALARTYSKQAEAEE
jgi:hypothetical protein